MGANQVMIVLMMACCASRFAMIGVLMMFKPVAGNGLREQVTHISKHQFSASYLLAFSIFMPLAIYSGFGVLAGTVLIMSSLIAPIGLAVVMQNRIGGFNGDVLGGICVLSEVSVLIFCGGVF